MFISQSQNTNSEINTTPLLEKRRIIGSMRERTVFVPVNPQMKNEFKNNSPNDLFPDLVLFLKEIGNRINEHVEQTLDLQESIIDIKIKEIDDAISKHHNEQMRLERQIKKIKKTILSKRGPSYSLPMSSITKVPPNLHKRAHSPPYFTQSSVW